MLQLPTQAIPTPRITKVKTAEISRGAKIKAGARKAKPDPIIDAIKRADVVMDRYITAASDMYFAKIKLDTPDRGYPAVPPIDEPEILREFGPDFRFGSELHVVNEFHIRRKCARQRLIEDRAQFQKRKKAGHPTIEQKEHIECEKRLITVLTKFEPRQKLAARRETARLHKVQQAAGFIDARTRYRKETKALRESAEKIALMKPRTLTGALAVVDYVRKRLFPDRRELFFESGGTDANFWRLLQLAHLILAKNL